MTYHDEMAASMRLLRREQARLRRILRLALESLSAGRPGGAKRILIQASKEFQPSAEKEVA
jgi:hypothetical protein